MSCFCFCSKVLIVTKGVQLPPTSQLGRRPRAPHGHLQGDKSYNHEHSINCISRHGGKLFNEHKQFKSVCIILYKVHGNISTNPFTCLHMSTHNTTSREGRLVYQRPKSSSSCKLPNQRTAQMSKYHLTHLVKENFPGFIYKS